MQKTKNAVKNVNVVLGLMVGLFLMGACAVKEQQESIPVGLIPADTLIDLLVDIHLADAYLSQNRLTKELPKKDVFYAGITKKYGYTRMEFDSTIRYLATQPRLYASLYEEVLNELSVLQGQVEKEKALETDTTTVKFESTRTGLNQHPELVDAEQQDSIAQAKIKAAQNRFQRIKDRQRKKKEK